LIGVMDQGQIDLITLVVFLKRFHKSRLSIRGCHF
jgi:hypothetical protein